MENNDHHDVKSRMHIKTCENIKDVKKSVIDLYAHILEKCIDIS